MEPVSLSPLLDQLTGFVQLSALTMLQHLFYSYGSINKIDLEENAAKMIGPYNPAEPLDLRIEQLQKGVEFAISEVQTIYEAMVISKGITILTKMGIFNDDIREWIQQSADLKTWTKYNLVFHKAHQYQKRAVTTAVKGGYTATVQNIYGVPPPRPEEYHEVIEDIQKIMQVMQTQGYKLEGMSQANAVLTRSNSTVMAQLAQMTVTMNAM